MGIRQACIFLKKYIKPYAKHFGAFYVGWLFETVLTLLIPFFLSMMLDAMIYRKDLEGFFWLSIVVAVMSVYTCVLYYWLYAQHHYIMAMFTFEIKKDAFEQFLKVKGSVFQEMSFGEIMSIILEYPHECVHFFIRGVIHQLNNGVIAVVILALSFRIDIVLGAMMLVLSVLCSGVSIFFGSRNKKASLRQGQAYGRYIGWVYEILEGLTDIRMLSAARVVRKKNKQHSRTMFHERNSMELTGLLSAQAIKGIFLAAQLLLFGISLSMSLEGRLSIGMFTLVMTYFKRLSAAISDMDQKWNDAQTRAGYVQKIKEFLEYPAERDDGKKELRECEGAVSFQNVSFSYGEKEVYRNFSLDAAPGEKIAVVGESGSGKSTLASMLIGMQEPSSGRILIDGEDMRQYTKKSFRTQVGIVFQENMLFEGSIKENLLLAKKGAGDFELLRALNIAELADFVESLPEGMDTFIGECGIHLSAGQRQRLAIAQICLRNPRIIIFDEATSALDYETERRIVENLKKPLDGHTVFFITHRKTPIELCDRVLYIEEAGNERFG